MRSRIFHRNLILRARNMKMNVVLVNAAFARETKKLALSLIFGKLDGLKTLINFHRTFALHISPLVKREEKPAEYR